VTQEKVNTGRSAPVDLLREQAEQADARQVLLAAQNNASLVLVGLRSALGVSQASSIALSDSLNRLFGSRSRLPASLQDALRQAEVERPELALVQKQVEAAQSGVSAAQGTYAPQVYGVAMGDAMTGQGVRRTGYTLELTASLPLYDGGQRQPEPRIHAGHLFASRGIPAVRADHPVPSAAPTAYGWLVPVRPRTHAWPPRPTCRLTPPPSSVAFCRPNCITPSPFCSLPP